MCKSITSNSSKVLNTNLLPSPRTLAEIQEIIIRDKEKNPENYDPQKRTKLDRLFMEVLFPKTILHPMKTGRIDGINASIFNASSLFRSMIQMNEANNKLICSAELLHALRKGNEVNRFCLPFGVDYSGGTIVPTLYYSTISAITSHFSLYGCILYNNPYRNHRYNIIRTVRGWTIYDRKDYLNNISFNDDRMNWHKEIIKLLEYYKTNIDDFCVAEPKIIEELSDVRNRAHYEILGSINAGASMGLDDYFSYLPKVINLIESGLQNIWFVWGGVGEYCPKYLAGFDRFDEVKRKISTLYEEFDRSVPVELSQE